MGLDNDKALIWDPKDLQDPVALEAAIRQRVLDIALREVGTTDPAKYFEAAAPCYKPNQRSGKSWCQIFDLYCYRLGQLTTRLWVDNEGFLGSLPLVSREQAKPADATVLQNTRAGKEVWHGNLLRWTAGWRDYTVDGNTSEGVATRDRDIRDYSPRPTYRSIQPWVDAYAAMLRGIRSLDK